MTKAMVPPDPETIEELSDQPEAMSRGGSVVVSPSGDVLAGPLWDEGGLLYAALGLDDITRAKIDFDVVGHYARPDIFQLQVNREPQPPVAFNPEKKFP